MSKHIFKQRHAGFSLIEILVVVGIVMLLLGGMVKVAQVVRTNAITKNTETTIRILTTALETYREKTDKRDGNFKFFTDPIQQMGGGNPYDLDSMKKCFYPPPSTIPNGFSIEGPGSVDPHKMDTVGRPWGDFEGLSDTDKQDRVTALASIEFLYNALYVQPDCQALLNKISGSMTANADNDFATFPGGPAPLIEVIDGWGHPLWYKFMGQGNFPQISSAGQDGLFNTADDIISSEQ